MIVVDHTDIDKYAGTLCNLEAPIAERVDALFCLKSFEDIKAVEVLKKAFEVEKSSELLRHEICYCLGQMDKSEEHIKMINEFLTDIVSDDKHS
jgi:deoxyhypusine monooxygenase